MAHMQGGSFMDRLRQLHSHVKAQKYVSRGLRAIGHPVAGHLAGIAEHAGYGDGRRRHRRPRGTGVKHVVHHHVMHARGHAVAGMGRRRRAHRGMGAHAILV